MGSERQESGMHGPGIKTPASIGRFVCFSGPFMAYFLR